jgi:MtaA/CmuA family methyltransferase
MQFAAEYIGSYYGAFVSDHKVLVEANLACAHKFDLDQLSTISDPYREVSGFGAEIRFHRNSVPECGTPPLAGIDDFSNLQYPDPATATRMKDRIDAIHLYKKMDAGRHSILGWIEGPGALAANLRGLSEFFMDLLEEPEWCAELMDRTLRTGIRFAQAQIEAGADTIGIGDAMCSQVSGNVYEALILPRQKTLVDAIHDTGAYVRLHICGQTRHLWRGMAQLGVDIVDCDHMVDLVEIRKALGSQVVIAGNIDPVSGLRYGNPQSIRKHVRQNLKDAGSRYMVCAGCEVPSGTPVENLASLCEAIPPARG